MWIEKNGPTYRIRDLDSGGRKVTIKAGFDTKTAASHWMTGEKADKLRGDQLRPKAGDHGVGDFLRAWWATYSRGLKPSGRRSEESRLRVHLVPDLGGLTFDELEAAVIQDWIWDLTEELSPKTIRNIHGLLYSAMEAAVADRYIKRNPCRGTRLPEPDHKEMRFLTEPEAQRLINAIKEKHRPMVILALATGLRWGEVIGLRVKRVDVLEGRLWVIRQLIDIAGAEGGYVEGSPKTKASSAPVSLPPQAIDAVLPLVAGRHGEEFVFTRKDGVRPIARQTWRDHVWAPATVAAGLEGLRFHDLRHTHAAWLISAKVPLTAVQRRLRHKSIATTSDLYGHLLPEVDQEIHAVLSRSLAGKRRGILGESTSPDGSPVPSAAPEMPAQAA